MALASPQGGGGVTGGSMIVDLDIAPLFASDRGGQAATARRLASACERSGFLRVRGHGVAPEVPQRALAAAQAFFAGNEATKRRLARRPGTLRGYVPTMPFARQRREGAPRTIYEAFLVGEEALPAEAVAAIPEVDRGLAAPNRWPTAPPDFRSAVTACYDAFAAVGGALLRAFALAMGREEDALTRLFACPLSNLSLLHYPARPEAADAPADDVFPHRDTNAVTVLLPGEVGGLQVQRPEGGWTEVTQRPGTLIVNIGNMMESWSGGRFPACRYAARRPTWHPAMPAATSPPSSPISTPRSAPPSRRAGQRRQAPDHRRPGGAERLRAFGTPHGGGPGDRAGDRLATAGRRWAGTGSPAPTGRGRPGRHGSRALTR